VLRVSPADAPERAALAVLYHLACHPTAMGGDNYRITADWPGQVSAFVEGAYGPTDAPVALFLQGCAGNIRPDFNSADGRFRSATWSELAGVGRAVGGEVVRVAEQGRPLAPAGVALRLAAGRRCCPANEACPADLHSRAPERWQPFHPQTLLLLAERRLPVGAHRIGSGGVGSTRTATHAQLPRPLQTRHSCQNSHTQRIIPRTHAVQRETGGWTARPDILITGDPLRIGH
jgi:hypothetical protein